MFLTRIGFGSTAVVTGDVTQVDLPRNVQSGLRQVLQVLKEVEGISMTCLLYTSIDLKDKIIAASIIWSFYFLFFLLITEKIKIAYRDIYLILGGLTLSLIHI